MIARLGFRDHFRADDASSFALAFPFRVQLEREPNCRRPGPNVIDNFARMAPVLNHAPATSTARAGRGLTARSDARIYHGANRAALNLYRLIHKEAPAKLKSDAVVSGSADDTPRSPFPGLCLSKTIFSSFLIRSARKKRRSTRKRFSKRHLLSISSPHGDD